MVRIAPVRLAFNPKTLWFDSAGLDLSVGDAVVVSTARGHEFGHVAQALFDMEYEETKKLRSPLKPVVRLASDDDVAHADELAELSMQALPVFKQMANMYAPDMHPIAVEYLFGGEKAVFYFDSEERIDFRDLVRKLAAEFQVRVDMKQIGVRDGARMVGGIGHCGQELCCARLGGDFNPVSIRMAKEQDLSLNPQKISGLCGRLMCCLRYEFDAYKDFHGRAPKKNARVDTPDGEGKVVDLDVPREVVSIRVGDEKPVKVPLADMDEPDEGKRPTSVGTEAWERANSPATAVAVESLNLFSTQLSGEDKLAGQGVAHAEGIVVEVASPEAFGFGPFGRRRGFEEPGNDAAQAAQAPFDHGFIGWQHQGHREQSRRRAEETVFVSAPPQARRLGQQIRAAKPATTATGKELAGGAQLVCAAGQPARAGRRQRRCAGQGRRLRAEASSAPLPQDRRDQRERAVVS